MEERGEGPAIVLVLPMYSRPEVFEPLTADLARDHRVITYDPRGMGRSTREGPFDLATDAADLGAVIETAGALPATTFSAGNGSWVAVTLAAERPDLVDLAIVIGGPPVPLGSLREMEAFGGSESVIEMLLGQLRRDPRAALRAMLTSMNPVLGDEDLRDATDRQAEYVLELDAAIGRAEAWVRAEPLEASRALGPRLVSIRHPDDSWFSADAVPTAQGLLPEARFEELPASPLRNPAATADVVRALVGAAA